MSRQELVDRAKAILAEAYEEAAELVMLYVERTGEPLQALCKEIDPENWAALRARVRRTQEARKAAAEANPTRPRAVSDSRVRHARSALREADDGTFGDILASLPDEKLDAIARKATETAVDRARARRAEHRTEPTVRELSGGERFDPAEFWADTLIIRVNRNARELESLLRRGGGLRLGTMPIEEAFEYLHDAEKLIAEARAAAQEQVREAVV